MNYRYYYFADPEEAEIFTETVEKFFEEPLSKFDEACSWGYENEYQQKSDRTCVKLVTYTPDDEELVRGYFFGYSGEENEPVFVMKNDDNKVVIPWRAIGVGCAIFALGVIFGKRNTPVRITKNSCRRFIGKNPLLGPFSYEEAKMLNKLVHSMDEYGLIFAIDPKLRRKRK